eukprot:1982272-Pleurochrysis_carterae.AAC.1
MCRRPARPLDGLCLTAAATVPRGCCRLRVSLRPLACAALVHPARGFLLSGGCNYEAAIEFIKFKFMNIRKDKNKPIYIMETTATNTENMAFIFKSMVDIVERQNLQASGFS